MNNLRRNYMTTALVVVLFAVFLVETFMGGSESTSVLLKMGAMFNRPWLWRDSGGACLPHSSSISGSCTSLPTRL